MGSSVQKMNPSPNVRPMNNLHNFAPGTSAIGPSSHSAANPDVIR
jgi:hypothetical protein